MNISASFSVDFELVSPTMRVVRKRRGRTFVMNVPWWDAIFIKA